MNIRLLVDDSFVPLSKQLSVIYCRLTDFWSTYCKIFYALGALCVLCFSKMSTEPWIIDFWCSFYLSTGAIQVKYFQKVYIGYHFIKWFEWKWPDSTTAKWISDKSKFFKIKPSFDIILCQDLWRFAQIFTDMSAKLFFVIVARLELFKNNNNICANLCKSSQLLEQCHVNWWLIYWNNRSV